jgi:hypothetical protein
LKIVTKTDVKSNTISVEKFVIDANTYANVIVETTTTTLSDSALVTIATEKQTKSYFDYEIDANEAKRRIKILKPEFASAVEEEFRRVISNGA